MSEHQQLPVVHLAGLALLALGLLSGPRAYPQPAPVVNLEVSSYLGGVKYDSVRDIAFDSAGNFYIVGGSEGRRIPHTYAILNAGVPESTSVQNMDVFVAKFGPSGQHLWTTLIGGPNYERAYAIEVDAQGFIYVAGRGGAGFPVTARAFQTTFMGGKEARFYGHQDGFVFKMSPDGSALIWASYFGASDPGMIRDLDIDAAGNVYVSALRVAGSVYPAAIQNVFNRGPYPNPVKGNKVVVAKVKGDGSELLWAMHLGGSGTEAGESSIRVDAEGNPVVLTATNSTDIPTTAGAYRTSPRGGMDFYVAKVRSDGSGLMFATYLGGSSAEAVETHHLALDAQSNVIVAAGTTSTDFPMVGAYDDTYNGSGGSGTGAATNYPGDAVVAKLSADGSQLVASTYLGGRYGEQAEGVWLDRDGNVWLVGGTHSDNFPLAGNPFQRARQGVVDGFVAKLSSSLERLIYSTYFGGGANDYLRCAAADAAGNVYFGGETLSDDLPVRHAVQTSYGGQTDGVFGRFSVTKGLMPDYTTQLEEIARVLSRPATPVWVPVLIASILSFASAFLIQFAQQRLGDRFKRQRMRRVLYIDLAELFSAVEGIMQSSEIEEAHHWEWQKEQLKLHVVFKGEKYVRANENVYMQMPERMVADKVYTHFHRALDDLDRWSHTNWSVARQTFAQAVAEDRLKREHFQEFLGEKCAERLYSQCKSIHEESQRMLKAMERSPTDH